MVKRTIKAILLFSGLALGAYIALIMLDKRAQWQAFLELEQEQLEIVSADGFIEREFGVDSSNRLRTASVSSYARYTSDYADRIYDEGAVRAFLAHAPEPKFDAFILIFSQGLGSGRRYGYPVSWCGDRYCEFDSDLIAELVDYRFPSSEMVYHSFDIEKGGYKFFVSYALQISSDEKVDSFYVNIGSEPRNLLDRFWAEILQIPSRYSIKVIYRVDYVTGWTYLRENMQDG